MREENARLKQALQQREQQLQATQASTSNTAKVTELADKVRVLELENAQLKATGSAISAGTSPDLARAKAEIEVLASQKAELQKQLAATKQAAPASAEMNKIAAENAELKTKLETLNRQITATDTKGELAKANKERDALKQQLAQANTQLMALQKRTEELASQQNRQNDEELKKRVSQLQLENATLKSELSSRGNAPTVTVNPNMKAEFDKLQAEVARLQVENAALSLQVTQRQNSISNTPQAQNFDLAQATKRYEEAQREIRRLGAIIQAQDAKHTAEKREIEGMLFDPAIASSAQVALKQSYEQRINDLENQMRAKGIAPTPTIDPNAVARMVEPASGTAGAANINMPTGYAAVRPNTVNPNMPPPAPMAIPPITEAEIARDMMPLPVPQTPIVQQPIIQQVPVERVVERIIEKPDPKKEAELAQISQELKTLRQNQEKQAQENATLRTELLKNQKAKEEAEKMALVASQKAAADAQKAQEQIKLAEAKAKEDAAKAEAQKSQQEQTQQVQAQQSATVKPVEKVDPAAQAPVVPPPVALPNFISARDVSGLLKSANIPLSEQVADMGGASDTYRAFRWKTGELFGSIEQRVTGSTADYRTAIASYMDRARARCKGDFAAEPSSVAGSAPNSEGYEIACIGGKVDTSASVLFSFSDRIMTTIAHEGKTDIMGEAMNARDQIAQRWGGSVTASR